MIRTINKFFSKNSRWLFGIFTVIIIVSFMGFLTPGTFGGCGGAGNDTVGTVFGKKVSYQDLRKVMIDMNVFMSLMYGMSYELSVEQAFSQYAYTEVAKQRGLNVSDKEVTDFIINLARFRKDGKFDIALYNDFVKNMSKNGISSRDIQEAVRNGMLSSKLQESIRDTVVVTDDEVENFWRIFNGNINARIAEFKFKDFEKSVKYTDAELQEYFKNNRQHYKIPASSGAWIACFDYSNPAFVKEADSRITEKAMKDFYEQNKNLFTAKSGQKDVITPYEKAKNNVRVQLRDKFIKEIAFNAAQKFSGDVYDEVSMKNADCKSTFAALAAKNKINVIKNIPRFNADAEKVGVIDAKEFAREIIAAASDVPITNAVAGKKGAYVAVAVGFKAERPAELKEVRAKVVADFRSSKARQNAIDACEALIKNLSAKKPSDMFAAVKADKRFAVIKPFNMASLFMSGAAMQNIDEKELAIRIGVNGLQHGEISKLLLVPGGVATVFVEKRDLADVKNFASQKDIYTMRYTEMKVQSALNEFNKYLSSQCVMKVQQ